MSEPPLQAAGKRGLPVEPFPEPAPRPTAELEPFPELPARVPPAPIPALRPRPPRDLRSRDRCFGVPTWRESRVRTRDRAARRDGAGVTGAERGAERGAPHRGEHGRGDAPRWGGRVTRRGPLLALGTMGTVGVQRCFGVTGAQSVRWGSQVVVGTGTGGSGGVPR